MFSRMLVPTDFSPHSDRALSIAIDLAKLLHSEVSLVLAFGRPVPPAVPGEIILPNDFWGTDRDGAKALLEERFAAVSESGLMGDMHFCQGHPEQVIVDLAESMPADLIIMGSRGRTGLSHVLVGSVAERTLRLAPCPVLTVKAKDEDAAWERLSLAERSPR